MKVWQWVDVFIWCWLLFDNWKLSKAYKELESKYWQEVFSK